MISLGQPRRPTLVPKKRDTLSSQIVENLKVLRTLRDVYREG